VTYNRIELWRGVRGKGVQRTQPVLLVGEPLGVVDVERADGWVDRCALYRARNGSVIVHRMRLDVSGDGMDVAETHIIPAPDAELIVGEAASDCHNTSYK